MFSKTTVQGRVFEVSSEAVAFGDNDIRPVTTVKLVIPQADTGTPNAEFHTIRGWDDKAIALASLQPGDIARVEGKVVLKEWEDQTGKYHARLVLHPFSANTIRVVARNGRATHMQA